MHFLVIQHLDIEPPALVGEVLCAAGHQLHTVRTDLGERLPEHTDQLAGIIVMGGPQSANDVHLPWLADELAWIGKQLAANKPMLGICLGAQLMAKAAGGSIKPSPRRELGWFRVTPTNEARDDALFTGMPWGGIDVFQWHGETFSLPQTAQLLVTHGAVPAQAFRLGRGQYGLQFHVEVDEGVITDWVEAGESERAHLGAAGITTLYEQTPNKLPVMRDFCRRMIIAWLQLLE